MFQAWRPASRQCIGSGAMDRKQQCLYAHFLTLPKKTSWAVVDVRRESSNIQTKIDQDCVLDFG